MAIYHANNSSSGIGSVEFSPVGRGNLAFFMLRDAAKRDDLIAWLQSPEVGQHRIAETVLDGQPVIVTQGNHSPRELLHLLKQRGEVLNTHQSKEPFNWWQLRGKLGISGQLMQLTSSFLQVEKAVVHSPSPGGTWVRKGFSVDIGIFAILNLIANFGNMFYGAQKEPDTKRLHYVKALVNEQLSPHLPSNETALSIDDNRTALRRQAVPNMHIVDQFNGFAHRHSVRFFELGLRYVAALALVIPFRRENLSKGWNLLTAGEPMAAYKAVRNTKLLEMAGLGYIFGKTIAWFSKVRDPYDDAPHSWVDRFREDWLFTTGSIIESAAGVAIATQAFKNKTIAFGSSNGAMKPHRDWLGVTGGAMFAIAYIARLFAKFGTKNIDVNEVIAHTSDTLVKTPSEQLPQRTAEIAATLTDHFADKKISYGEIYSRLRNDFLQFYPTVLPSAKRQHMTPLAGEHPHEDVPIRWPTAIDTNFAARVKQSRDAPTTERAA
jgi:hypothetical protein